MVRTKFTLTWVISLSLLIISISAPAVRASETSSSLTFGVYPEINNEYYLEHWKSVIEYLSEYTGQKIQLEVADSLEEFEDNLSQGKYDLVFLNANKYTDVHNTVGYSAFAKERDRKDTGVIVVQQDSKIKSIDDLKSQTLAFSDPSHFSSTVLTQSQFNEQGIPVKVEYVESDKSVYRGVDQGDYTAGGGKLTTFNDVNPSVHARLRVIWTSKQYSSNAFAVHPRVSSLQLTKVRQALIGMGADTNGMRLLANVKLKGIAKASDEEWNDIRALKRLLGR